MAGVVAPWHPDPPRSCGWRGFHHHPTLAIAAYGFLISERATISPQGHAAEHRSMRLLCPEVTDPAAPRYRPERHVRNSLATVRVKIASALVPPA
jgi:hypothetical protein